MTDSSNQAAVASEEAGSFQVTHRDDRQRMSKIVTSAVERCFAGSTLPPVLASCLGDEVATIVGHWSELYEAEKAIRMDMSDLIEDYACADPLLPTSEPIESSAWSYVRPSNGVAELPRQSDVLFDKGITSVDVP